MMMFSQPYPHAGPIQMPYGGARHDLPTTQAPNQKYPQQPQQPSAQMQPKAPSTTKRATKALLIVDPDTNKPLDLVGVSSSSKSKSPEPASVTSPTQDAKREEFMAKISGKSNVSEDSSQPEPTEHTARLTATEGSPATQEGETTQQLAESMAAKDGSAPDGTPQPDAQPQLSVQSKPAEPLQPAAPTQPMEQTRSAEKPLPMPLAGEKPAAVVTPLKPTEEPMLDVQPQAVKDLPLAHSAKTALPVLKQTVDAPKPTLQKDNAEPYLRGPLAHETSATAERMQKPVVEKELVVELDRLPESRVEKARELNKVGNSGGCAHSVGWYCYDGAYR